MAAAIQASLAQDQQGELTEDEALARAMQASLAEQQQQQQGPRRAAGHRKTEESSCAVA